MTKRRITLKIDRVTLSSARISRRELTEAIERELGQRLHQSPGDFEGAGSTRIASLAAGRIKGRATAAGVGQAVAQATLGVIRR